MAEEDAASSLAVAMQRQQPMTTTAMDESVPPVKSCFRVNVVNIALKKDVSSSMADAIVSRSGMALRDGSNNAAASTRTRHIREQYYLHSLLKLFGPKSAIKVTLLEQGNESETKVDVEGQRVSNAPFHGNLELVTSTKKNRSGGGVETENEEDVSKTRGRIGGAEGRASSSGRTRNGFEDVSDTIVRSSLQSVDKVISDARAGKCVPERERPPNAVELPLASFPAAILLPATTESVRLSKPSRDVGGENRAIDVVDDDEHDDGVEESASIKFEILQHSQTAGGHDNDISGLSAGVSKGIAMQGIFAKPSSSGILRLSKSAVELMKAGTPVESTLSMSFMRHLPARRGGAGGMRASVDGSRFTDMEDLDAAMARVMGEVVLEVEVTMLPIMSILPLSMTFSDVDSLNVNSFYEDDEPHAREPGGGDALASTTAATMSSQSSDRRVLLRVDSARIVRSAADAKASSLSSSARPALPPCFVAIKTAKMAAEKVPATSQTSTKNADAASGNATLWDEVLALSIPEQSLHSEKVLVALVDASGNRLLGKSVLPTAPLATAWPHGRHIHLQLQLDTGNVRGGDGGEEEKIFLNVSICLEQSSSQAAAAVAAATAAAAAKVARVADSMRLSVGVGIGESDDSESDDALASPAASTTRDTTLSVEILGAGAPAQADTKFRIVYKSVASADADAVDRTMRTMLSTATTSDIVPGWRSWHRGAKHDKHCARTCTDECDATRIEDKVVRVRITNLDCAISTDARKGKENDVAAATATAVNDAANDAEEETHGNGNDSSSSRRSIDKEDNDDGEKSISQRSSPPLDSFDGVDRLARSVRLEENASGSIVVFDIPLPEIARCLVHASEGRMKTSDDEANSLTFGAHVLRIPTRRLTLRLDVVVSSAAIDDASIVAGAGPVAVDIETISRSRAIFGMSQLALDAIAHQRTVRRLQDQCASANASMLLLAKKAIDECDMRMEVVRDLEHVRSLLDEERRQRNAPQLLFPGTSGSIHAHGVAGSGTDAALKGGGGAGGVVVGRLSKAETARHVKEGLAYIHGLRDVDALKRACTTTFHHLVREQQRSRDAHARLKDLHQESIERQKMKKKYKELCDAHAQQQHVVAKLEESVARCERYKETIVGQERVISTLETLLTEASTTTSSTAASAGASAAKIESLEHARAGLANKVAEVEEALRTRTEAAADELRKKEEEHVTKLAEVKATSEEKAASLQSQLDEANRRHEEHLQRSLEDVEGINDRNKKQVDELTRRIESMKSAHADELEALRKKNESELESARTAAARAATEAAEARVAAAPPPEQVPPPPRQPSPGALEAKAKADEELRDLQRRVGEMQSELNSKEEKLRQLNAEKLQLSMKCDKQETRAVSSENALLDATRKFARQIAELKSKLAEKDAALLGGFGSVSTMALNEIPGKQTIPKNDTENPPPAASGGGASTSFRLPTPPASLAALKM